MKCEKCKQEKYLKLIPKMKYEGIDLDDFYFLNVQMDFCPNCGDRGILLPKVTILFRDIALQIFNKPTFLTGKEFRFLRRSAKFSKKTFCEYANIKVEELDFWESNPVVSDSYLELMLRTSFMLSSQFNIDDIKTYRNYIDLEKYYEEVDKARKMR